MRARGERVEKFPHGFAGAAERKGRHRSALWRWRVVRLRAPALGLSSPRGRLDGADSKGS